jgi:hypothetical protein
MDPLGTDPGTDIPPETRLNFIGAPKLVLANVTLQELVEHVVDLLCAGQACGVSTAFHALRKRVSVVGDGSCVLPGYGAGGGGGDRPVYSQRDPTPPAGRPVPIPKPIAEDPRWQTARHEAANLGIDKVLTGLERIDGSFGNLLPHDEIDLWWPCTTCAPPLAETQGSLMTPDNSRYQPDIND